MAGVCALERQAQTNAAQAAWNRWLPSVEHHGGETIVTLGPVHLVWSFGVLVAFAAPGVAMASENLWGAATDRHLRRFQRDHGLAWNDRTVREIFERMADIALFVPDDSVTEDGSS